jgi:hypothetical protein
VYALLDRDDAWHLRVRGWWGSTVADVRLPVTVLPEICYLLAARLGPAAESAFVAAVAGGEFVVEGLETEDLDPIARLVGTYLDLPVGFTDASVAAIAGRLGTHTILTTDRRHFSVIRPADAPAFRLVP